MVAIRALTRVASLSFSRDLSLNVTVDLPSDEVSHHHQIIHKNRYMKQTYEVYYTTDNVANKLIYHYLLSADK